MKLKKIFTSLVIAILISVNLPPAYQTSAAEAIPRPTEPEKACADQKPELLKKDKDGFISINQLNSQISKGEIKFNHSKFDKEFEKIQEQYHGYAECIFDYAEKTVLGTKESNAEEWNNPPSACISQAELKKVIDYTSPNQMLEPLLETYNEYGNYLDELRDLYQIRGEETGGTEDQPTALSATTKLQLGAGIGGENIRLTKSEKENALVAMDISFKSLKQLRMAYVMHVHFQCMLKNLEKYRQYLEKIRIIVEALPGILEDASMVCK
jgi:hypothetical protein